METSSAQSEAENHIILIVKPSRENSVSVIPGNYGAVTMKVCSVKLVSEYNDQFLRQELTPLYNCLPRFCF